MNAKQELLMNLRPIISEQLGVPREEIAEASTWIQLGADSLDRMKMSLAVEEAFKVDIPHSVGERLNTVGETADHLLSLIEEPRPTSNIQIEAATTRDQWTAM